MVLTTGWPVRLIPAWAGKTPNLTASSTRRRLIPARAGKTLSRSKKSARRRAHPRAGGENDSGLGILRDGVGSSPRGRGKHVWSDAAERVKGLIPARAGKTSLGGGQ